MSDERYCQLRDQCTCGQQWRRWQYISENEDEWLPDEFVIMLSELQIANLLDCIARRCPDPEFRKAAAVQLKNPRFSMSGQLHS